MSWKIELILSFDESNREVENTTRFWHQSNPLTQSFWPRPQCQSKLNHVELNPLKVYVMAFPKAILWYCVCQVKIAKWALNKTTTPSLFYLFIYSIHFVQQTERLVAKLGLWATRQESEELKELQGKLPQRWQSLKGCRRCQNDVPSLGWATGATGSKSREGTSFCGR